MKPELVLNEEQKNQRFRSSFNLRCDSVSSVSINTDYRRQEETSPDDLLEGTEENLSGTDYSPGLSNLNVMDPLPPKQAAAAADIFQSFSYDDIAVESIEKD